MAKETKEYFKRYIQKLIAEQLFEIATHGGLHDGVLEKRRMAAQFVCNELCAGEFRDIKKKIIVLMNIKLEKWSYAAVEGAKEAKKEFLDYVFVNARKWAAMPEFYENNIREILRHELVHVLTGWGDDDPRFQAELKRRGIKDF